MGVPTSALLDPGSGRRRVSLGCGERDVLGRAGGVRAQALPQRRRQLALARIRSLERLFHRWRHHQAGYPAARSRTVGVMDRKWWTLIVVCIATFMLLLDITIVNVALPAIERDLNADFADLQWVIDAYALTLAAVLLTGGSLADLLGRRLIFVIGVGDLHLRLAAVRARRLADVLNLVARAAGHRRRVHVLDRARAARLRLPGPRPRHRVRRLGRGHRRVGGGRAAGRRRAHRRHRLGGDLPRQPADRHRRDRAGAARRSRSRRRRAAARIDWPGPRHVLRRAVRARSSGSSAATPRAGAAR